jgi:hypothetical protein
METVNNPDMKTKYVYTDEFLNNENDKPIELTSTPSLFKNLFPRFEITNHIYLLALLISES